jgi:hypothetical protein
MTAREKAETLRQEAIQGLLAERQAIDDLLVTLGHGRDAQAPIAIKRKGRPPKAEGLAAAPRDHSPAGSAPV